MLFECSRNDSSRGTVSSIATFPSDLVVICSFMFKRDVFITSQDPIFDDICYICLCRFTINFSWCMLMPSDLIPFDGECTGYLDDACLTSPNLQMDASQCHDPMNVTQKKKKTSHAFAGMFA